MTHAKIIYTAEPQKFFVRIWNEMILNLAFAIVLIGAVTIWTKDIRTFFGGFFVLCLAMLFNYIKQYKYRFIQAVSIIEEDGDFIFELLYKDEFYTHVIKKNNISITLKTEDVRLYASALTVFDREIEAFVLYSGSSGMKEADLEKIKVGLNG